MRRAALAVLAVLDAVSILGAAAAITILMTGGVEGELLGRPFRARGIANPCAFALIAAGLARLLDPGRGDALVRAGRGAMRWLEARFGPRAERLRGFLALRGDALLMALLALWVVDRGLAAQIEVEGDGVGYYAYVRSPLMDRDLDFANEWELGPKQPWTGKKTRARRLTNPFSIGPAVIWSPFFATAWLGAEVSSFADDKVAPTGYDGPFVTATAGATWLVGLLAVVLVYRTLLVWHRRSIALAAAVAVAVGSPLAFYLSYAPFYSHAHAFFAVALFLVACLRFARGGAVAWLGIGLAGGLMAITRWQDAVVWVVPAIHLGAEVVRARGAPRAFAAAVGRGLMFLVGVALIVLPQLLVFQALNGYWLGVPQGKSFVSIIPQHLGPVLFSWFHGLYSWTPLLAIATVGLALAVHARRPWAAAFAAAFLIQLWVNAGLWQWWAGHAFGARRFASAVPLLALGLAEVYHRVAPRIGARRVAIAVSLGCIVWTHFLVVQWLALEIPHGEAIDPGGALARALSDLASGELRKMVGHDTVMSTLLYRLRDLVGARLPLVVGAAAFYGLSRLRGRRRVTIF